MPTVAIRDTKAGDVIKHEYAPQNGYCRELVEVDLKKDTVIGSVFVVSTGELVAVATSAEKLCVVVDPAVYNLRPTSGSATNTVKVACLVRGPAIVGDLKLVYGVDVDTDAEKAAVAAQLKSQGILVEKQV